MAENSNIEWTTHTFNPVRGCVKVSEGCEHCYAETMSGRNPNLLGIWGRNGTRIVASADMWKKPLKWNKFASECKVIGGKLWHEWGRSVLKDGPKTVMAYHKPAGSREVPLEEWEQGESYRPRVFCASLADVFEDWRGMMHFYCKDEETKLPAIQCAWHVPGLGVVPAGKTSASYNRTERRATFQDVRDQTFRLIEQTPHLDWLLLTKRPENVMRMVPESWRMGFPENVWMGTTVENQKRADERIPLLLSIPAKVRFLSCEPLLGPVDITTPLLNAKYAACEGSASRIIGGDLPPFPWLDWVICGGESGGPKSRPMHPDWARSLRDQCKAVGVPFFFKQWGDWLPGCQYREGDRERLRESAQHSFSLDDHSWWVGKAKAGRLLDGHEHNGFPNLEGRAA